MSRSTHHSPRVHAVLRWLDADRAAPRHSPRTIPAVPLPQAGEVLLLTGASGSGKTTLLRRLIRRIEPDQRIMLARLPLPSRPVIDLFPALDPPAAMRLLAQVGLGELHNIILPPSCLSQGQRWRLRLALAIAAAMDRPAHAPAVLIADEFAALLDRTTAMIVAHRLRRAVQQWPLSAILATSHDDLAEVLAPALVVRCDFGKVQIDAFRPCR